eukprot:5281400-Pyramimonas_sp.AAC.1
MLSRELPRQSWTRSTSWRSPGRPRSSRHWSTPEPRRSTRTRWLESRRRPTSSMPRRATLPTAKEFRGG